MKKITLLLITVFSLISGSLVAYNAPTFNDNFAKYLTDATPDKDGRVETVFSICIDRNITLMENIKRMFYPTNIPITDGCTTDNGWLIWGVLKVLWFAILFIYVIFTGISLLMNMWDSKAVSKALKNFIYIWYWAFLFFGSVRLLWSVLNISTIQGSQQFVDKINNSLFFQILSFFKTLAFFGAIIMIIVYWFQVMYASDEDAKVKKAMSWIRNVVIALVLIKVIDYIFFIAQTPDFTQRWADFIIDVAKILGYLVGALFVIYLFYAGFMLITGSWDEAKRKKVKTIITIIALSSVVIFLFLLILYQIFSEFGGGVS